MTGKIGRNSNRSAGCGIDCRTPANNKNKLHVNYKLCILTRAGMLFVLYFQSMEIYFEYKTFMAEFAMQYDELHSKLSTQVGLHLYNKNHVLAHGNERLTYRRDTML